MKQGVHFRDACQDLVKNKTKALRLFGVYLASHTVILLLSQASFPTRAESQPSAADRKNSSGWRERFSANPGA